MAQRVSRRRLLGISAGLGGAALLAACGQAPAPPPTTAPAAPTKPAAPAAAPTTAPAASRGALYAIDDYLKRDKIDLGDMYDVGKFLYSYAGKTYGLTEYLGPLMVMYNPKAFEAAGVAVPPADYKDPSWTLDAVVEKAKALTKRSGSGPAEPLGLFVSPNISPPLPNLR